MADEKQETEVVEVMPTESLSQGEAIVADAAQEAGVVEVTPTESLSQGETIVADAAQEAEVVEVTRTVEVTQETAATGDSAIDWDAAPAYEVTHVEETIVTAAPPADTDAPLVYPPRGPWDFTDAQRIIIGVLIWLNLLVLAVAYVAVSGLLSI